MTKVTLNIPDNELGFFMKLIEKFNYETVENEFSISEEMKNILDERRASSKKEDFIPWEDAKKKIRLKSKE